MRIDIKNVADGGVELFIYGEIGWETDAGDFARELASIEAEKITVRVSSPGGDAYQGIAIMNALRAHPAHVTAVIEGLAASAASFIAVGGADRVVIRPHAEVMIHDAMAFIGGNAGEMQKAIADLDRISDSIADIYAQKAGGEPSGWRELMRAETWYSADEAVAAGLADVVEEARESVAARAPVGVFNLSKFKYPGRRASPSPVNHAPQGQESKEVNMADLKNLAQELGMEPDALKSALTRIVNEQIEVVSTVDVAYPSDVTVVPTGKVTIAPVGDDLPDGLAFALGEVPEGWVAEINDTSGVLTVTAPAVAPGESASFAVTAQGTGEATEFSVTVTVKSAAEDEPATPEVLPAPDASTAPADGTVTVPVDVFNDLKAAAAMGWERKDAADKKAREDEVDAWIREGRANIANRAKIIDSMHKNPEATRSAYLAVPKNTIPVREIGYSADRTTVEDAAGDMPSVEELKQRAAARSNKKGNK